MNELGELLRNLRGKRSLREVAKQVDISHTYISDLEKGFRRDTKAPINPSPETLKRLADAYDYPYEKLMSAAGYIDEVADPSEPMDLKTFDSLYEITQMAKKYGLEQLGFFDIEEWKNLSPEEIKMLDAQFRAVAELAKKRNKEKEWNTWN